MPLRLRNTFRQSPNFERDSMSRTKPSDKTPLAIAVAAALTCYQPAAYAAEATEVVKEEPKTEVIQVRGIRGSLARSMDVKRESPGVVDAISAEEIGKFPDTNVAESLQRISGVSIDRSGGEGQLITVRGFGPQFNTVLVNGRQMATENQSRAFSFDTLASELVRGLDVYKTSTAAKQSGGIGSTINVNTARPFALGGFKVAGSVKGVYDENSEKSTPQITALVSNTFNDDTFGVLVALSHQARETRLNQAQIDGWLENVGIPNPKTSTGDDYTGNVFSPRNYDHKVTFEERKRTNANLVLQYAPSDNLTFTLDGLYSDFDVESDATSYGHWFTAPNVAGIDDLGNATRPIVDANGTVIDLYQEVGLATDMHAKKFDRITDSTSVGFNADWQASPELTLTFDAHFSEANREPNNGRGNQLSLIGYANRVRFQTMGGILPVASLFNTANPLIYSGQQEIDGVAYSAGTNPAGVGDHLDPANSRAHVMLRRGWAVKDEVQQFRFDGEWDSGNDSGLTQVRFGTQYTAETKNLDRWDNEGVGIHCTYCGYPDMPPIANDFQYIFDAGSDFLSGVSGSGQMPTQWLAHDGEAHFRYLEDYYQQSSGNSISFDAVRRNISFQVKEKVTALYIESDYEFEWGDMFIQATAGLRYEKTDTNITGTNEPLLGLSILDETEMLAQYGEAASVEFDNDYSNTLPNLSVKVELTDDVIARFAASRTLTRPTLESLSPVTVVTTTRQGGDLTSRSGNPNLKPFKSDNLDLSLEWYYDEASYASVGFFVKNVDNFIVNNQEDRTFLLSDGTSLTDPSTGSNTGEPDVDDQAAVFTNTLPTNGESARVEGWELAGQHTFGESGFGVLANATLVDSDAQLDPSDLTQTFALTGLSDSANLVLFYEKSGFQIRLAYNWRDEFVQSLTQVQGDGPTIVEDYRQVDISASYDISDNFSVYIEGINLTEEYVHKRGRYSNHLLLIEDSGARWALGVRGSL